MEQLRSMRQVTGDLVSRTVSAMLVVCAVLVSAAVVKREFFPHDPIPKPIRIEKWEQLADVGMVDGPVDAPVTLVVFSDFQCPFCARLAPAVDDALRQHATSVRFAFRHFPLAAIHPHAEVAALSSECAREQQTFKSYHDRLFTQQDSMGLKPWVQFAREAGVPSIDTFAQCLESERFLSTVESDLRKARDLRLRGTPTVFVNDVQVPGTPTSADLDLYIRAALGDENARKTLRDEGLSGEWPRLTATNASKRSTGAER